MQHTSSSSLRRRAAGAAAVMVALALASCAGQQGREELTTGSIPKLSRPVQSMNATELGRRGRAHRPGL
ncbi:Flp pilus assembly protein TadD [Sinorhizobium medicae]